MVDNIGNFLKTITDCDDVIHTPDDDDVWTCMHCGHSDAGIEFNIQ